VEKGKNKKKYRDGGVMDNIGDDYCIGNTYDYYVDEVDPVVANL